MTTYTWTTTGIKGDWTSPNSWNSNSGPPGFSDFAFFGNLSSAYTVNVGTGETATVASIIIAPTVSKGAPAFSIKGSLTTRSLIYQTPASGPNTNISVNSGGLLDITTSLPNPARSETIFISGRGTGGVGSGGHLELGSLTVGNGSNLQYVFQNNDAFGALSNTGVIEFSSGYVVGSATSQTIKSIAHGDEFIIDGANFTGDTVAFNSATHTLTVNSGPTTVFTMNNVSGPANSFVAFGDVILAVCYARGTMIGTPDGELPVERLRPGRQVLTLVDGEPVPQVVKWLGHRRISLTNHPRPETVAPIRIQRDAFADGIPQRDLVVSPDHAVFVEGKLICARHLVNGTTIHQEFDWTAVDYYHVELDRHAILLAEGLPAESYIDTGNSGFFANSGVPLVLHPDLTDEAAYPTREAGSCAPFVWDEASVHPVWQRLAERAAVLGRPALPPTTTTDPDLRLRVKSRNVKPIYADGSLAIFALPRRAREVRLISRAQSPTMARPWLEDRRQLGVRITRIVIRTANDVHEVAMDHPGLSQGWWAVERDGQVMHRWTDGDAVLALPPTQGDAILEVHLSSAMPYVTEADPALTERRAA